MMLVTEQSVRLARIWRVIVNTVLDKAGVVI